MSSEPLGRVFSQRPVLCVDVDGTLLRTDLLFESFLYLVKQKPWLLLAAPFWLIHGKAYLKQQLARRTSLASVQFPLDQKLLQFLKAESETGRRLILCSGSDEYLVNKVAGQLDFPVEIIASDGAVNLVGKKKAQALVERFGSRGFDYVGNASEDLPVWDQARHAILVNAAPQVREAAQEQGNVTLVLPRTTIAISAMFRALRTHQWVKNTLVCIPLITSHKLFHADLIVNAAVAFLSMSFCASSVYIMNDLSDIGADRKHHSKRNRPFASGELSIPAGLLMAPILLALGVTLSLFLPPMATVILLAYIASSAVYTFWLKRKLLADVITLSLLYTLRIVEGGTATSILVSPWLLAFSVFLFSSLAFSKRVAEMLRADAGNCDRIAGRGYLIVDTSTLANLGAVTGYLACLVLTFYINSGTVSILYPHPGWLWLLLPLLLNWIGRIWVVTMRGRMSDDPITYLSKDLGTHLTLLGGGVIIVLAMRCPFGIPGVGE